MIYLICRLSDRELVQGIDVWGRLFLNVTRAAKRLDAGAKTTLHQNENADIEGRSRAILTLDQPLGDYLSSVEFGAEFRIPISADPAFPVTIFRPKTDTYPSENARELIGSLGVVVYSDQEVSGLPKKKMERLCRLRIHKLYVRHNRADESFGCWVPLTKDRRSHCLDDDDYFQLEVEVLNADQPEEVSETVRHVSAQRYG